MPSLATVEREINDFIDEVNILSQAKKSLYLSNNNCKNRLENYGLDTPDDYRKMVGALNLLADDERKFLFRYLCRTDLYFLLWYGCKREDAARQWVLERCKEVQENPNGYLDLWAREHYKSTIITFAKTIQDILSSHGNDPLKCWNRVEPTFGLFSCTRPLAKGFLRQIKREFEANDTIRQLFTDVIWDNPTKEAPKWSEDDGIILKRKTNPKESTVEAWGLVDGQPTSKHFTGCIYDDVVTIDNTRSPDMIKKTNEAWELSINLGSENGFRRYVGTRYHFNDTYRLMKERKSAIVREYTATVDSTAVGEPVLISKEYLQQKRRDMGIYTFSCQMLMNPVADDKQGFKEEWLDYHNGSDGKGMNIYITVDSANEKKKTSDYTAIEVVGLAHDGNYYTLDMIRDRLNLTERTKLLIDLHRKWNPIAVGYERYGLQADVFYIKEKMKQENYKFEIIELGGIVSKNDRIRQLVPVFEQKRWLLPRSCFKTNYEGILVDLTNSFIEEEYKTFPVCVHDDLFDAKARIVDPALSAKWPKKQVVTPVKTIRGYGGLV